MRIVERVLLYVTALVMGVVLLLDGLSGVITQRPEKQGPPAEQVTGLSKSAHKAGDGETPQDKAEHPAVVTPQATAQQPAVQPALPPATHKSFVVTDESGRPRIELFVDENDDAQIVMKDSAGASIVVLRVGADSTGEILLQHGSTNVAGLKIDKNGGVSLELTTDKTSGVFATATKDGSLEVALRGKTGKTVAYMALQANGDAEIGLESTRTGGTAVLAAANDGQLSLRLTAKQGAQAQLLTSETGETEVSVVNGSGGTEALLRTDDKGAAEIAVRDRKSQRGTSLSIVPQQGTGLHVVGGNDGIKAVMQVFEEDGLAEIAIKGADSQSGPSMIRTPDGASVISVHSPKGKLGATMMTSPDGQSIVTVTNTSGKGSGKAELRVAADGKAGVLVTNSKGDVTNLAAPKQSN